MQQQTKVWWDEGDAEARPARYRHEILSDNRMEVFEACESGAGRRCAFVVE